MSDKETTRNETPWRARGFKKPFSGTKNYSSHQHWVWLKIQKKTVNPKIR